MIDRLRNSWTYRSAGLYRRLARWRPIPVSPKPSQDLLYLTLGAAAHLEMMEASVRSLAATWDRVPRLRIVLADDTPPASVESRFAFWPGTKEIVSWRAAAEWSASAVSPDLAAFAEREPMGRKMAAVFQAATEGAVLYADVDLLWFREPASLGRWSAEPEPFLAMSTDMVAAYDDRLVRTLFPELSAPPFYCAGVMYATGAIHEQRDLGKALAMAARDGVGVTEQTTFAALTRSSGGHRFPEDEIYLSDIDRLSRRPTFPNNQWSARHYVGQVRHLFWRDAVALAHPSSDHLAG